MVDASQSAEDATTTANGMVQPPATAAHESAEDQEKALEWRLKGNDEFKKKHYQAAVEHYTRSLDLDPASPTVLSNRSFAYIRLEEYGSAIADASAAIAADPKLPKGYYRRGDANFALGHFKAALKDFKLAARLSPKDPDLRRKLAECERINKRLRFEESLSLPDEEVVPTSQRLDLSTMTVEDSYEGPRLEGSDAEGYRITPQFVQDMLEAFRQEKKIHVRFAFEIVMGALRVFKSLPTLVDVDIPAGSKFTVCGDVHGQFYDLLHIFELNGAPSEDNPYLFNGDFVDRGSFSAEVILTLFAYKWLLPGHMHLARGNHESKSMNMCYGFDGEVKAKYSATLVDLFREAFCWLPLGHLLNSKVLVVHGGLFSQDGVSLSDVRAIDRNMEPPGEGLMCELLWSDPQPQPGRSPSKRGVGVAFGPDVSKRFLEDNNLDLLVRSHEVKDEGYEIMHDGRVVTIFSAPNYCDQMGNKGAYITFRGGDMTPHFTQYSASPHPAVRPMQYAGGWMAQLMGM